MKYILALLAILILAQCASAQNVTVIGPAPIAGNIPIFNSPSVIKDSGIVGGAALFANPTGSVGLTTVNGAATTALRSDAAPPLSASVQSSLTGTSNQLLLGTSAFGFSALGSLGTTTTTLHGNAGGSPTFAPVVLTTDVTNGTGVDANVLNSKTANYTILNTDCGSTIQAGTGATGLFTVTLPAVTGFPSNCSVWVINQDTGRGKILSGFPTGIGPILYPLQAVKVEIVGGAWVAATNPGRWRLPTNISFFVNNSVGADTNDGLAAGSGNAFLTIQKALDTISNNIDLNGLNATIQLTAGQTYTTSNNVFPFVGRGGVILDGATTAVVNGAGGAFLSQGGGSSAAFTIQNVTVSSSGAGNITVFVQTQGYFVIGAGVTFGSCGTGSAQMAAAASGAVMQFVTSYTISGGCARHLLASNNGLVTNGVTSLTVTLTGTPAFSTDFAQATDLGMIFVQSTLVTYSGSAAAGNKALANLNGVIDTTGGGLAFFPGSVNATTLTGGQYN